MRSKARLSEPWGPEVWDRYVPRRMPVHPPLMVTGSEPATLAEDMERCMKEQMRRSLEVRAVPKVGWGAAVWDLVDAISVDVEIEGRTPRVEAYVPERLVEVVQARPEIVYVPGVPPV